METSDKNNTPKPVLLFNYGGGCTTKPAVAPTTVTLLE